MRRTTLAGLVLLALFSETPSGEQTKRIGLDVLHNGGDRVGKMLAADLKEHVARSALFIYNDQSIAEISLASLDIAQGTGPDGIQSAVSVQFKAPLICKNKDGAWNFDTASYHSVYIVGRNRTETIAKEILADFGAYRDKQRCTE